MFRAHTSYSYAICWIYISGSCLGYLIAVSSCCSVYLASFHSGQFGDVARNLVIRLGYRARRIPEGVGEDQCLGQWTCAGGWTFQGNERVT